MTAQPEAAADTLVGRVLEGRFAVLERLAAGGMGVVYKAEQQPLGRIVALKILELSSGPADESFSQRFFLEASAAAQLAHPNTIVVHDYGKTSDGLYFIAMEYLGGGTLSARLKRDGPLAPHEALHVGLQVASSLRDAHETGLVHRDLKPGNVMFAPRGGDPLFVKVLDFGLVKMLGPQGQNLNLTQSGVMMGSPRYMAPEQVKSQPVDARTDIYSFGAVLYHAICGAPPFSAGSAFEAMNHHVYTAPPSFRETWAECPAGPQLEAVVMRCLQKETDARYQSMDAVMEALRACGPEAGASASVGSYLSVGSSSGGEWKQLPAPDPAPASPEGAAPVASPPAPAAPRVIHKTVMLDEPAPVAPVAAVAPVEAPRGGGALKLAVMGFVLVFAAGAAAMIALLVPLGDEDDPPAAAAVAQPTRPEPAPDPTPPPEPAPAPAAAVRLEPLMLRTDPTGATVRRDGQDLGDTPIPLLIEPGQRWTVEIAHEGYTSRTVTVLGGQAELTVHLEPVEAPRAPVGRRAPVPRPEIRPLAPEPRGGPSRPDPRAPDLDNPWAR